MEGMQVPATTRVRSCPGGLQISCGLMNAAQLASLLPALLAYLLEHQPWAHARALTVQQRRECVQSVLPPCRWFEVDQLEVIQYKHRLLKSAGAAIRVSHAQQVSSKQSSIGQAWERCLASSSRGLALHEVTGSGVLQLESSGGALH